MSDPQQLKKLHDDIAAMGISWNDEAGRELNGEPLRLWDEDGDQREDHPWIAGQCLARKNAAALVQKFIESAGAVPSVSPAPQEQERYERPHDGSLRDDVRCVKAHTTVPLTADNLEVQKRSRPAVSTPNLSHLIAEFMAKWTNEANGYVRGSMMESPVGDMNRASASVVRTMLRELEALLAQTRA